METSIFQKDKGYISASRAAEKVGYTTDYIGQLCRRRKVPARLVGRTWHVDLAALIEHKGNHRPGRRKGYSPIKKKDLPTAHGPQSATIKNKRGESAYLKPVMSSMALTYQNEIGPLLPKLFKKASEPEPSVAFEIIKQAVALATALVLITTTGLALLEQTSPQVFSQVETRSQLAAAPVLAFASGSFQTLTSGFLELREVAFGL